MQVKTVFLAYYFQAILVKFVEVIKIISSKKGFLPLFFPGSETLKTEKNGKLEKRVFEFF
ncbi:MAG: hypothetical protein COA40_07070 [Aequorivita sp.]|nr:MAG: hypothetical protein COA40_07070 [Aequorivita sp.]